MTNEFAIKVLTELKGYGDKFANIGYDRKEALDMAIKALEQSDVLDKIRAEIEHLTITEGGEDYIRKMAELCSLKFKVLQIIDKYKAESEDSE